MADYNAIVEALRWDVKLHKAEDALLNASVAADAIEELLQTAEHYKGCSDDWYREACDYKAMIPSWIPVTERFPNRGDKVIVAIRDESGDTKYDYTYCGWYSGYENRWIVDDEYCSWVTHWQPLPKPPKEET